MIGRVDRVAAAVAGLAGGDIHLVHVVEAPPRRLSAESEFLGLDEDAVSGRREAEARVVATATRLSAEYHYRVTSSVIESDRVAEALIRHAGERGALLVVMATLRTVTRATAPATGPRRRTRPRRRRTMPPPVRRMGPVVRPRMITTIITITRRTSDTRDTRWRCSATGSGWRPR